MLLDQTCSLHLGTCYSVHSTAQSIYECMQRPCQGREQLSKWITDVFQRWLLYNHSCHATKPMKVMRSANAQLYRHHRLQYDMTSIAKP